MILISHFWSFQPFHCGLTLMNSQIQMANLFFICYFMFSLLATFTVTSATETDLSCLKSIRDSMIDPNNYLSTTWNFNNNTEGFICRFMGLDCWHPDENRVLNLSIVSKEFKFSKVFRMHSTFNVLFLKSSIFLIRVNVDKKNPKKIRKIKFKKKKS